MKSRQIKPLAIAITLGLSFVASDAFAGRYMDGAGNVSTNNYGECWKAAGGAEKMVEQCGDVVMMADPDSDGDGVPDSKDNCPNTPAGVKVNASGCAVDGDNDGVPDDRDRCLHTRAGAKVDMDGCEIIESLTINLVQGEFDFDSAVIKPGMKAALNDVIKQVKASPGNEKLSIVGHTCSMGSEKYNQGLSERRAKAVADYLAAGGVSADRMTTSGMGESSPVADNGTDAGRSTNRRVEINTK